MPVRLVQCIVGVGVVALSGSGLGCGPARPSPIALAVARISPASGATIGATRVTIYGSGFRPGATVTLGRPATDVSVVNEQTITATTPAGPAGAVDVVVTNPGGESGRLAAAYSYAGPELKLEASVPGRITPGSTAQFTALLLVGDIAEDVTSTVQWRSSSTTLVVRPGGFATATARGEATVTASLQGMTATREVMILEPGTFRLSGTISTPGIPYSGATIEVIDGNGAGLNGTFWRSYALYGVAGPVRIRVSAEGFELVTRDVTVLGHTVVDLDLRPTTEASLIAGVYSLTMSASPACSERLPEWLRQRSFDVIVTVESSEFRVRFMSSTLDETHGEWIFPASLWNERLKLDLPYGRPFVDGMLLEDLRAAKYFALSGTITATAAKTELRGAFDGRFALYDGSSPGRLQETAACQDSAHEAVFRRQPGR